MKSFVVTSIFLLTLVLASVTAAEAQARKVLQPRELCSDYSGSAIATFEDADLEAAVRTALSIGAREDLTCGLVSGLTVLSASGPSATAYVSGSPEWPDPPEGFETLTGIQNLTSLTRLNLNNRWITDISALSGLTSLTSLNLHTNWINDISALSGLTSLTSLFLSENPLTDISPLRRLTNLRDLNIHTHSVSDLSPLSRLTSLNELRLAGNPVTDLSPLRGLTSLRTIELTGTGVTDLRPLSGLTDILYIDLRYNSDLGNIQPLLDNPGIGAGDVVELRFTSVTCADQARLAAKGVEVRTELFSACR